jgi:quinolinate synthase
MADIASPDASKAETLFYSPEVAAATDHIYPKIRHLVTEAEWQLYAPLIDAIRRLKDERNACILAHNYQAPEIFSGISDYTGDSLGLARQAAQSKADVIVMCGVHFMAETAKLLNPERIVLIPDTEAGCSLAESITPEDVRELRRQYPDAPVVTYVNTSAAVKAECDICCTSSNAVEVVESLGADQVIFLPDGHLAGYVAAHTKVDIIDWKGVCVVHDEFRVSDMRALRRQHPGIQVAVHPECKQEVQDEADVVGSTSQLQDYIDRERPEKVALITECTMSGNLSTQFPDTQFIQPCSLCPYMKKITLEKVYQSLKTLEPRVEIDEAIAGRARTSLSRMLAV